MDDNIALVVADLTKATKLKMPAMVVMVHQMRDIYDRIEALTTQLAEARESERAAVVAWLRALSALSLCTVLSA